MEELIMKANSIEDKRQNWKVKHNLVDILVIVMLSVLTGHNDFEEMVIFAEARLKVLRKYIKLENAIPHKDTIKRVIAIINPNELNLVFYSWLASIIHKKNHVFLDQINKIIAFDGKTICGSDDIYIIMHSIY
ncbi:MAG: ISAs1 family transposase [bacterium]|nr:ISAs1 family transposase [bacterium]